MGFTEHNESPVRSALHITERNLGGAMDHVWVQIVAVLVSDCSQALSAVQNIAVNYRMTRKPPPKQHSSYVDNLLAPLKRFMSEHSSTEIANFTSLVVEGVCSQYLSSVASLLETARKMDTVIQRRTKGKRPEDESSNAADKRAATSDSDKILLQLFLDIVRFGDDIQGVGLDPMVFEGYRLLKSEVSVAEQFVIDST